MLLYHGTSVAVATSIEGDPTRVSVTVGGGELGRGFYAGDHVALAAAWARGRFPRPQVLEVDVNVRMYVRLDILTLNWAEVVSTWNQLKISGTTHTYLFHHDVVHGPLATYQHATQHKFESSDSERVLHASTWRAL